MTKWPQSSSSSPSLRKSAKVVGRTDVVYFISSIAIDELMSENSRRVSEKFVDLRRNPDINWQLLCRRMRSRSGNSPAMNQILTYPQNEKHNG
jgi:hypothetical protein